jgi:hypothetical protein
MSAHDVYVENFRESVRVCQQCILWCIGASFSGVLLAWKMTQIPPDRFETTLIPLLFGEVRIADAWGLALLIYVVLGAYSAYLAGTARLNAGKLIEINRHRQAHPDEQLWGPYAVLLAMSVLPEAFLLRHLRESVADSPARPHSGSNNDERAGNSEHSNAPHRE